MSSATPSLPEPYRVPEAAPYWEGAARGVLRIQFCTACQTARFYPRQLCPACGGSSVEWRDVSGRGVVYSFSVVHRGPTAAFRSRQPYVVALIDLAEGPRMMSNIIGDNALDCAIGDAVTVEFETRGDVALPVFRRAQ